MRGVATLLMLLIAAPAAGTVAADPERALRDELERSLEELRLGDEPRPYFLSYRLDDVETIEVASTFGSTMRRRREHYRVLSAELRTGSPERDNTNFFSPDGGGSGVTRSWNGSLRVPVDDDYRELRRHAWLLTDATYKRALENLARKRAALENRRLPGDLPDFTPAAPATSEEVTDTVAPEPDLLEDLVAEVSRIFRQQPAVAESLVQAKVTRQRSLYLNSEGTRFERSVPMIELLITATAQAVDGTQLTDAMAHYGRSIGDLPSREALLEDAEALGGRLAASRVAAQIERYNGPVLFVGQAAAELFHQVFAPAVAAWRPPVAEDERLEQRLATMRPALSDRLGGRVLARSMRLVDDPLARNVGGRQLFGGFTVDDEGVPSAATTLVERGILKGLVASRTPARGAGATTGNRRGASALPSNLLLSTSEGRSPDELRAELVELVKERDLDFGVIVRRMANPLLASALDSGGLAARSSGSDDAVGGALEAVKVFRDGREEPLRDPRFSGLSASSFRDIVGGSARQTVYTAPMRPQYASVALFTSGTLGSALTGPQLVSVVVPDLLFEELTIAASVEAVPRPPVIPHPYFATPE